MSDYLKLSTLQEVPSLIEDQEMVTRLIQDHSHLLEQMKDVLSKAEAAEDEGTIDMMGGYIRELEKQTWMLNAWSKTGHEKLRQADMKSVTKTNA